MVEFPMPKEGIVLTHFIVSADVERSRRFYADVLGGETVRTGEPSMRGAGQRLDHHQCRRRSDGRQADRHVGNAV